MEPVKVFDNLYFFGQSEYSVWAITTSQGIIVLDAIFDYSVEDEVVEGLKKLGLDPAQIKFVIISHGHLDHAGGAKLLQDRFGARLVMSAADYDLLDQQNPPWKPKRDIVATDGYKLTLGDTTVTTWSTPGHTPGHISLYAPSARILFGGDSMTALLGGHVDVLVLLPGAIAGQLKAGTVRILTAVSAQRDALLPDVPTLAESGLTGFDISTWFGLMAPAGTPADVIAKLQKEVATMLKSLYPGMKVEAVGEAGKPLPDGDILGMNWYVKGIDDQLPQ